MHILNTKEKNSKGTGYFDYDIIASASKSVDFYEVRAWMWDTWGPSKEIAAWIYDYTRANGITVNNKKLHCFNQHWAWCSEHSQRRLYLKGEKELMLFKLRWE